MAKIIVFGNQKGGVGKSTLTALTAAAMASLGRNVYVADTDTQGSLTDARALEQFNIELYPIVRHDLPGLIAALDDLDRAHDVILIDAAGKLDVHLPGDRQEISKILLFTDVLIVPVTPGNFTTAATLDYVKLAVTIRAKRGAKRPLKILLFINQAEAATRDHKEQVEQLQELATVAKVGIMTAALPRYTAFRVAATTDNFYQPGSKDRAKIAFSAWLNELMKTAGL